MKKLFWEVMYWCAEKIGDAFEWSLDNEQIIIWVLIGLAGLTLGAVIC